MKSVIAFSVGVIFFLNLASCQNVNNGYSQNSYSTGYNQNGYTSTGTGYTQPGVNQVPAPTYTKMTTYQTQPNGVQTSSLQETVQNPSTGAQQTVVTKTVTAPMGQPRSN